MHDDDAQTNALLYIYHLFIVHIKEKINLKIFIDFTKIFLNFCKFIHTISSLSHYFNIYFFLHVFLFVFSMFFTIFFSTFFLPIMTISKLKSNERRRSSLHERLIQNNLKVL